MSEIHFVFEKPEKAERPEKKRSRLVTSCDAWYVLLATLVESHVFNLLVLHAV